jgi:hypothetical protein
MKLNADVRDVPWKKVLIGFAVLLFLGVVLAGYKVYSKKAGSRPLPPAESRELVLDYLKKKSGKDDFTTSFDFSKLRSPWDTLKTAYDAPPTYEAVYRSIGEHLQIAEKMINSEERKHQGQGLKMMGDLAEVANEVAVDPWLSGRICDAYMMPHLGKFEENPKNGPSREQVMHYIGKIYRNAGENDRLIELGKLYIADAPSSRRSDEIRWRLVRALESKGEHKEALKILGEIKDPSLTNEVAQFLQRTQGKGRSTN